MSYFACESDVDIVQKCWSYHLIEGHSNYSISREVTVRFTYHLLQYIHDSEIFFGAFNSSSSERYIGVGIWNKAL